jgi:hypothetical protein
MLLKGSILFNSLQISSAANVKKLNQKNNMKRLLSLLIAAILLLSPAGCQEQQKKGDEKPLKPDLALACEARYLCSDGSWYLTEQRQKIFIKPAAIKITAQEPFGEIVLTTGNGQFLIKKSSQTKVFDEELFSLMTDEGICRGLLALYPAELKKPQINPGQTGNFTFKGQLYDLVFSDQDVEIYKNKTTQKNDLVITRNKKGYILYGYNYLKREEGGYFPSKIDVYSYNEGADRVLIAQYDCRLL